MGILNYIFIFTILIPVCYGDFACHSQEGKTTLHYLMKNKMEYELVEFKFPQTGLAPSMLSCASLLEQIKSNFSIYHNLSEDHFHQVLSFSEAHAARIKGDLRKAIYQQCQNSMGCELKFPFNLFSPKQGLNYNTFFKKNYPQCLEKKELVVKPEKITPFEELFNPIEIFDVSERKVIEDVLKLLNAGVWERVYLSSMTMSSSFIKKVVQISKEKNLEIHIMFSFTLQSLLKEFPDYLYELPPTVHIHPIFITPSISTAYHIKGALFVGPRPKFLFFTGNFRNHDDEIFSDMAMIAEVKRLKEVENHFTSQIRENCQSEKYFDCSLQVRFEKNSSLQYLIKRLAQKSCEKKVPDLVSPIAYNSRTHDMKTFFHQFIKEAKHTVEIQTHQFNDPELLEILDQLGKKGISVKMIIGTKDPMKNYVKTYIKHNNTEINYHSKFIIIDGQKLIWLTGNLTKTSYSNPWESTFVINDKSLIEAFKNSFRQTLKDLEKNKP